MKEISAELRNFILLATPGIDFGQSYGCFLYTPPQYSSILCEFPL